MLSPFLYFKKNKRRAFTILAILIVSVFCVSFVTTLIGSVYSMALEANVSPFEKFSIAIYTGNAQDRGKYKLQGLESVDSCYTVAVTNMSINTVFGTTSSYVVMIDDTDAIYEIMNQCNLSLDVDLVSEFAENEILMHTDLMNNKGLEIGDKLGDYKVSGAFSGDVKLSFGYISTEKLEADMLQFGYLLLPEKDKLDIMNQALSSYDEKEWNIISYKAAFDYIQDEFRTINLILLIVVIMVSMCISTAVAALVYTIYSNRYDEFAILNAIGYKKSIIKKLISKEILIISMTSWLIGYLLSIIFLYCVDGLIYSGMGQSMPIVTAEGIIYTLLMPIMVLVSAVLPVIRRLTKTDLISIIERR